MPTPSPGLCLEYLPLPDGGARLIRLYGETPCPVLPAAVDGRPLTELGPYCFAPRQRERMLPPESALLRAWTSRPAVGRYDFEEDAPADELPPRIAGNFLEEITLPDGLRLLGDAAFYDCRKLRRIQLGSGPLTVCSDTLTNTMALTRLAVRADTAAPSGVPRLLASLHGEVAVEYLPHGSAPQAVLWFPEFWEDIKEVPAHMLIPSFSGKGYHYRQCFTAAGAPQCKEYDAVLPQTGEGDAPATLAAMAFDRLRYPDQLDAAAAERYRSYLADAEHGLLCVRRFLDTQDIDALRTLLSLQLLAPDALRTAARWAQDADNTEAAALLAGALRGKASRRSYDFD